MDGLLADLDVDLVSALYRAAGEPDAFEDLVATLGVRYADDQRAATSDLRGSVDRQLDVINALVAEQDADLSRDPLERAVEEVPTAAIVIDPFGSVILTNEMGDRLFATRPGERFDLNRISPAHRRQFSDFIASARLRGNQRRIIIRLDSGPQDDEHGFAPVQLAEALIVETARRDHGCIALRTMEIPWSEAIASQLCEAFGLTGAECAIAREFYLSQDVKRVANARGTSMATVQTQIKSIFAKTETNSQAQLLQVLSLLSARAALDQRGKVAAWSNPIGREASFIRSDGLSMAYTWQGCENGKPVLVIHGHTLAHIFPLEADRLFEEAGLKLYMLSRPGFGHSGYNPDVAPVDDGARSIREFCAQLGLKNVPVITMSSGLASLSRALDQEPDLASVILHLGYLWFKDLPVARTLPKYQQIAFRMAHRAPRLLATFSRIAYRNMRRVGVDWYIDRVLGERSHDVPYFRSGENAGLIRAAAGHLLAQGPEVFGREFHEGREPALELLRHSDLPIAIALPEFDAIHDQDVYAEALTVNANVRLETLEDSGELYFYRSADQIARLAIRHFAQCAPGYSTIARTLPVSQA